MIDTARGLQQILRLTRRHQAAVLVVPSVVEPLRHQGPKDDGVPIVFLSSFLLPLAIAAFAALVAARSPQDLITIWLPVTVGIPVFTGPPAALLRRGRFASSALLALAFAACFSLGTPFVFMTPGLWLLVFAAPVFAIRHRGQSEAAREAEPGS